jgi:hypothetical protein
VTLVALQTQVDAYSYIAKSKLKLGLALLKSSVLMPVAALYER